ncbi:MAG: 16S rRNA (cytosine(1402)-N(4))-methyltransferase RsmH, partial [Burkholderiaceae bacterium]
MRRVPPGGINEVRGGLPGEDPWQHSTVMREQAIDALVGSTSGVYLDATFGRGGHTRALLERLSPQARVLAIDRDPLAVTAAREGATRIDDARFSMHHARFSQMAPTLQAAGVQRLDGVLFDLGVSSPQIDDPSRGFSFRFDAPLDMRMDTSGGETAAEFLARADERRIAEAIRDYGEERFSARIAKAIVVSREAGQPMRTTGELAQLVARCVRTRDGAQHPATRTFQALRIAVNAELEELEIALRTALELLVPGGRLVAISFHSLEDRIVKTFIAGESRDVVDRRAPFAPSAPQRLRAIARLKPGAAEVQA